MNASVLIFVFSVLQIAWCLAVADEQLIVKHEADEFRRGNLRRLALSETGALVLIRKNLLTNPSFELDDFGTRGIRDGLAAGWAIWGKGYGTYSDLSVPSLVPDATHGRRAQRIDLKAAEGKPLLFLSAVRGERYVKPEQYYTFSADVKVSDPAAAKVRLQIQFFSHGKWLDGKFSEGTADTEYKRLSVTARAPEKTDLIKPVVFVEPVKAGAECSIAVDSAQLEISKAPSDFCAGYSAETGEFISPPIDLGETTRPYRLDCLMSHPSPVDIRLQIRSARTREGLNRAEWLGLAGSDGFYAYYGEDGPPVLETSVEELDDDGNPVGARTIGWGENNYRFSVVPDAKDGERALKVEITKYTKGDRRWEVLCDSPLEPDADYIFTVWHKESRGTGGVRLMLSAEDEQGKMHWGFRSEEREPSTHWKMDRLFFRTPRDWRIKRLWASVALTSCGSTTTDCYRIAPARRASSFPINPAHIGDRWMQYRVLMSTSDPSLTPALYRVSISAGRPVPEVKWISCFGGDGLLRYCFESGERVELVAEATEYTGAKNLRRAAISVFDPDGNEQWRQAAEPAEIRGRLEAIFCWSFRLPDNAPKGLWKATVEVQNADGGESAESVFIRVREPYVKPAHRMLVGALVTDYGFGNYKFADKIVESYARCKGLELWKISLRWMLLEPTPNRLNEEYVRALLKFLDGAAKHSKKVQVAICQQWWPDWANNGDWDNINHYSYEVTKRLRDTWLALARRIMNHPALESYLIINEENHVRDADAYLRSHAKVISALRELDGNLAHRITVRPNTTVPYIRTRIGLGGLQDFDYGAGGYPTSAAWFFKEYASPVSPTSFLCMSAYHSSPVAYGAPGGIGEIGFFKRPPKDTFGDEEKLKGFQRAMEIAYQQGMEEFMLWGGGFSFEDTETYFPRLIAFRDELLKLPRPESFDLRVILDTGERLYRRIPPHSSKLDLSAQPYLPLVKFLDESGYTWFYTDTKAIPLQKHVKFKRTIRLSELKGKDAEEMLATVRERLKGIEPSWRPMPWEARIKEDGK